MRIQRDQISERTARRRAAEAKSLAFDLTLFPRWLYAGTLAIPDRGTKRKVELIHLQDPLTTIQDHTIAFGKAMQDFDT